jgi:DNA-binding NarL/FixJ family response regulator
MKKAIRIIIADDHSIIREGLRHLLALESDVDVIAEAKDGEETLQVVKKYKPDILLLDINMPIMNGLEVLNNMKGSEINSKVIMLTIHNEVEFLIKAIEIGIRGYVLKDSSSKVIMKAIKTVHSGGIYIEPSMVENLFKNFKPIENKVKEKVKLVKNNLFDLTSRELEVLKLISNGMLNKEIARDLEISEKTVKNHVSNLFKKMNVSDRTQAAVIAIKQKIIKI